jgi:hypothetical protein
VAGVVFLALAVLAGVGSAVLAWSQARRAASPTGGDPAALAVVLKRFPVEMRLSELLWRAPPGSWEHDLAAEALAAPDDDGQVAAVNLALSEVEHALNRGAAWPRTGTRIALLSAGFMAFAAYLSDRSQIKWSLCIVGTGAVTALTCIEAARSARRNAESQRRAIDELVTATFGEAAREEKGDAARHGVARAPQKRRRRR